MAEQVRAITVVPGRPELAAVRQVPADPPDRGAVVVASRLVGICGTDMEIVRDGIGRLPDGAEALVLGHEVVGEVVEAPEGSGLEVGALVAGIVRRPDPLPCPACARGDWDYCSNGGYVEHGIRGAAGFGRDRWRSAAAYLVRVPPELADLGVLVEPMSVVCKALETAAHVSARAPRRRRPRMLVTGAGPIGLLAAALGRNHGYEVTVLDRMSAGVKPDVARALGAEYTDDLAALAPSTGADVLVASAVPDYDVVLECTGSAVVASRVATVLSQGGTMVAIGICRPHERDEPSWSYSEVANALVRSNGALVGTVNAGRRHYAQAVEELAAADRDVLAGLITSRYAVADWPGLAASGPTADDVKVVVDFTS